jgi:nucleoside-diphosphate-sugar epimerase
MKILITGSSGFIGNYLQNHLLGHEIIAVPRSRLDLMDGSAVRDYIKTTRPDWIINCAVKGRNQVNAQDPSLVSDNLVIFTNLYTNLDLVSGLINFGSGAEFDITKDIDMASESLLWQRQPQNSYGLSKNLIARLCHLNTKCYNLRVFGCFDASENEQRPIQRLISAIANQTPFVIDKDRWFDMFSLADLTKVVQYVLLGACGFRDMNLVYSHKTRLSEILRLYCKIHGHDPNYVQVWEQTGLSYTGDATKITLLNLPLLGLQKSLELYKSK